MAQVLQQVPNNYETDLIFPIVKTAAEIAGIDYHQSNETTKTSLKVIGDHVRSLWCI
jgi:alanyl-tRNA synthetase